MDAQVWPRVAITPGDQHPAAGTRCEADTPDRFEKRLLRANVRRGGNFHEWLARSIRDAGALPVIRLTIAELGHSLDDVQRTRRVSQDIRLLVRSGRRKLGAKERDVAIVSYDLVAVPAMHDHTELRPISKAVVSNAGSRRQQHIF